MLHVPIDQRELKKSKAFQISNLEQENCGFSTSDTILFSELLMGINRSCFKHIALDNLVRRAWGACPPVRAYITKLQIPWLG